MPNAPMSRSPWITSGGILPSRSIRSLSTRSREEALEPLHEGPGALDVRGIHGGEGMHQVEPEGALEQLAHEARRLPFLLPRRLGDLAGLLLGGERLRAAGPGGEDVSHGSRRSVRVAVAERASPRRPCSTRLDHVALAALEVGGVARARRRRPAPRCGHGSGGTSRAR